jgi:hypothetical protein
MTDGANVTEKLEGSSGDSGAAHPVARVERSGGGHDRNGAVAVIPSSIVQAVCQIMVTVEAVKKSQTNAHGGYNFASTDDIYAAVTRKMGEVGLICMSLEDRCEIKRVEKTDKQGQRVTSQWAHMEYSFVLATTADTWADPRARRTLYIQVTGPQTFQAAQSYAEKSFLRSVFKLPTGDMDLDSMPQADNEDDQVALNGGRKRKTSAEGKRDGSVKTFNQIRADIASAINVEMLSHIREAWAQEWADMPDRWSQTLDEDFDVKMQELRAASHAAE